MKLIICYTVKREMNSQHLSCQVFSTFFLLVYAGIDDDSSDGDEVVTSEATLDLRRNAVFSYVTLMEKPSLPDVLVKLICWVVGEYVDSDDGYDMKEIVDKLYGMLDRRFNGMFYALSYCKNLLVRNRFERKNVILRAIC